MTEQQSSVSFVSLLQSLRQKMSSTHETDETTACLLCPSPQTTAPPAGHPLLFHYLPSFILQFSFPFSFQPIPFLPPPRLGESLSGLMNIKLIGGDFHKQISQNIHFNFFIFGKNDIKLENRNKSSCFQPKNTFL